VIPRRAHRGESISAAGTDMDRLGAQVHARGDDCAGVCCWGAQELRGGAHGRASRRRKIALDWPAEVGPRDFVLPRCVLILLLFRGALIGKATGGLYAKVEGMFLRI